MGGRELRVSWVDRDDRSQDFYLWPRRSLDRLEAGETVLAQRSTVQAALWDRDRSRWRLPFDRSVGVAG
jgi:hypothetical protein